MSAGAAASDETALPRCPPAAVGVPAHAVHGLLDGWADRGIELHSVMVVRHGSVAAQGWWAPYTADRPHLLYSLSKSFTSTAVGFAIAEGLCALDDRLVDLLPDHVPDGPEGVDGRVATITLADVLAMASGHLEDTLGPARDLEPLDLARGFLRLRPELPPGGHFTYNQCCTYAAGLVVQERSGQYLVDYLTPRLLEPLGVVPGHWDDDGQGRAIAFTGLHQRTEDIARFGQLLLQDGVWQGRRVLPAGWVELATSKHVAHVPTPDGNPDWEQGYGYQYWRSRHGFRGDGAYGQFCVVVPEADLVVATTAATEDMQGILEVVWDVLLPALDTNDPADPDDPREATSSASLAERLASLALPVVEPSAAVRAAGATFAVDEVTADAPLGAGVTLTVTPDGRDHRLELALDGVTVAAACGHDRWLEGRLGERASVARGVLGAPPMSPAPVVCRGAGPLPTPSKPTWCSSRHRTEFVCAPGELATPSLVGRLGSSPRPGTTPRSPAVAWSPSSRGDPLR